MIRAALRTKRRPLLRARRGGGKGRAGAYELVKSEGFPTLHIGNRILVPKEELVAWIK